MSVPPVPADEVRTLAAELGATALEPWVELAPAGTLRTFRLGDIVIRLDADPAGKGLSAAALAMRTARSATTIPVAPALVGEGRRTLGSVERSWLAYRWIDAPTLTAEEARSRAADVGRMLAGLHGARVFDLLVRFDRQRPMTLLESFKSVSDQLRAWLLTREADGLSQDMLTLTLSDLQRAMRGYALTQDHHFRPARRRVLLHGDPRPGAIVAGGEGAGALTLVNFENASLGDAAEDVAAFSLAAGLDADEETALLETYLGELDRLGRGDPRFLLRYFPRRFLLQLRRPVAMLTRLSRLKRGEEEALEDAVATLEELIDQTYASLAESINGLRGFLGGQKPVTVADVKGMGRLVAYEELLLEGRTFRIALTGLPYAGKTEVGATVARRLEHAYLNTTVLGRAVAAAGDLLEDPLLDDKPAAQRVRALFDAGFRVEPLAEPPYYEARLGERDVTSRLRRDDIQVAGAAMLDDEAVREAMRNEIAHRHAADGVVIEGAFAPELAPGRVRHFHLQSDDAVRRARLMSHRHDVTEEQEADALLHQIDQGAPPPPDGAVLIEAGDRPAGAAALDILWNLLPANRRPGAS